MFHKTDQFGCVNPGPIFENILLAVLLKLNSNMYVWIEYMFVSVRLLLNDIESHDLYIFPFSYRVRLF